MPPSVMDRDDVPVTLTPVVLALPVKLNVAIDKPCLMFKKMHALRKPYRKACAFAS